MNATLVSETEERMMSSMNRMMTRVRDLLESGGVQNPDNRNENFKRMRRERRGGCSVPS